MPGNTGYNLDPSANSLDPDETPSYSAPHPDPNCLLPFVPIGTQTVEMKALISLKQKT